RRFPGPTTREAAPPRGALVGSSASVTPVTSAAPPTRKRTVEAVAAVIPWSRRVMPVGSQWLSARQWPSLLWLFLSSAGIPKYDPIPPPTIPTAPTTMPAVRRGVHGLGAAGSTGGGGAGGPPASAGAASGSSASTVTDTWAPSAWFSTVFSHRRRPGAVAA